LSLLTALGCDTASAPAGRTVEVLSPSLPDAFDPHADPRLASQNVFLNVFEPLVRTDAQDRLRPVLAASWTNPEPTLYVFHLRRDVVFHDGFPMGAAEVAASLERVRTSPHFVRWALAEVAAIEIRDPWTVAFRTAHPVRDLVYTLANVPVTRRGPRDGEYLGTGPYRVTAFEPGRRVELRRFDAYWGPVPHLAGATLRRFEDAAEAVARLPAGSEAIVFDPPAEAVAHARRAPALRVVEQPGQMVTYLAFGFAPGRPTPFHDRRVRRALHVALDREALIREGAPFGGSPATQLVPPGVFGFDTRLHAPEASRERAVALLAEAGFAGGFAADLDAPQNREALARAVARQLGAIGLAVRPRLYASPDFMKRIEQGSDFYLFSWSLGADAGKALANFLHTRDPLRDRGLRNRTGYSNQAVDAAIEAATRASSTQERLPLLHETMGLLMEDLPWVPLFVPRIARIYPRNLDCPARTEGLLLLAECRASAGQSAP
jgi:peptide/nickel transport system substrate-binding protein